MRESEKERKKEGKRGEEERRQQRDMQTWLQRGGVMSFK